MCLFTMGGNFPKEVRTLENPMSGLILLIPDPLQTTLLKTN